MSISNWLVADKIHQGGLRNTRTIFSLRMVLASLLNVKLDDFTGLAMLIEIDTDPRRHLATANYGNLHRCLLRFSESFTHQQIMMTMKIFRANSVSFCFPIASLYQFSLLRPWNKHNKPRLYNKYIYSEPVDNVCFFLFSYLIFMEPMILIHFRRVSYNFLQKKILFQSHNKNSSLLISIYKTQQN